jgi:hypothetical protein
VGMATADATGPISTSVLASLVCGARVQRILTDEHGAPLSTGRTMRLATPAQRSALVLRDRGCVIPGCTAPISWCQAHHVNWWRNNGTTDIDNLALTCHRHHADIHTQDWELTMINGQPHARPTPWIDPTQTWRQNHHHQPPGTRPPGTSPPGTWPPPN